MEAVCCEEACNAGAAATQERPRRSDAGAATRSPEHLPGSRVDVLDTADAYPGWERDLRSEHSVILNPKTDKKKHVYTCAQGVDVAFTICLVAATQMASDELFVDRQERAGPGGGDDD